MNIIRTCLSCSNLFLVLVYDQMDLISHNWKWCKYIAGLCKHSVSRFLYLEDWCNEIMDGIVLGAMPLNNFNHMDDIIKKHNIDVVLSILEDFELEDTFLFSPIKPSQYEEHGIIHEHIISQDFTSITQYNIEKGIDILKEHIKNKKRIYIHCKSGRGRSATIVVCYLMKHRDFSKDEARAFTKAKRPQITIDGCHKYSIDQYEQHKL